MSLAGNVDLLAARIADEFNTVRGEITGGGLPARLGTGAETVTDWNTATSNGFYTAANTAANQPPVSGFYSARVTAIDANNLEQIAFLSNNVSEAADTKVYRRMRVSGTWGSWYKLALSVTEINALITTAIAARLGPTATVVTDWDTANQDGYYAAANTATNQPPVTAFYAGHVVSATTNYATQTIWDYANSAEGNGRAYRRQRVAGVWGSWYKLPLTSVDAKTMVNDVPAWAGQRTNPFRPETSFYNATETSMQRLRTHLVKSHNSRIRIGLWGHSISAGSFTSVVGSFDLASQIRRFLSAEQTNVNGTGFTYIENRIGGTPALNRDGRWTSITGWTLANAVNSMWASTTTNGAAATFVSDAPGTIVDVATFDVTGPIKITIDGIDKETFTGGGTNATIIRSFTGLANTKHTVTITTTSTTLSYLVGVRVRNTTGIEVSNHGQGGSRGDTWAPTGTYAQNYQLAQAVSPSEIVFLALGDGNEIFQGVTVANSKIAMQAILTALVATGAAVVLMSAPAMAPAGGAYASVTEATWDPYVSMLYDLADEYDIPLLDTRHVFVTYAAANTRGWMGDNIHPNDTGHAVIARCLATEMLKVFPYDLKPDALLEEYETPPTAPATGIKFFSEYRGWRIASMQPAGGHTTPLQSAMWANRIQQIKVTNNVATPQYDAIAAPTFVNGAGSTPTAVAKALTNFYTGRVRTRCASTAVAGTNGSMRTGAEWYTHATAGEGGFRMAWRVGFNQITATNRIFCGLSASTGVLANANPSTFLNGFGFGADSADANLQFMCNDGSGTATKVDLGANFPAQVAATHWFEMRLYAPPGGGNTVRWCIIRLNDGAMRQGVATTDLPAVATMLALHLWHNNGTTAATVSIDIGGCYIEMDN